MRAPALRRRLAVFLAALCIQAAAGSPHDGPRTQTWLEWLAARPRRLRRGHAGLAPPLPAVLTTVALLRLPGQLNRAARLPAPLAALLHALVLASTFNLLAADRAASRIERALTEDDLETARAECGALTGRSAAHLSESQIAGRTIASLATYPGQALLGPWIAYALFDLPAAVVYRLADAAGAAWGSATPWLSWPLRHLPGGGPQQRLAVLAADQGAGLAIVAAARLVGRDPASAIAAIDAAANNGDAEPEVAAMAAVLDCALPTESATVNADARPPDAADIAAARRLHRATLVVIAAIAATAIVVASVANRIRPRVD